MFYRLALAAFSILWIALTFYKPMNLLDNLGELLAFRGGVMDLKPLDEHAGELKLNAPKAYRLDIHLDEWGIPHIYGKDEASVAFGVGYMHARDRYFQMEMMTRKAQGKLAEFVGVRGIESDRFWIAHELDRKAQILLKKLKTQHPSVYRDVMAYGDGVNCFLRNEKADELAPEYELTGETPRPWEHHYSLLLSTYMAYMLSYSDELLQRQTVVSLLPADLREALYEHASDRPYSIIPDTVFGAMTQGSPEKSMSTDVVLSGTALPYQEKTLGSNNWAISASKSVSGNAILCNDTHLDLVLPSPWYEAHLSCPAFQTYGLTLPCGPYVVSGHNQQIAWGMTNAYWDENDQFELKVNPRDTNSYQLDGKWKKMKTKSYQIAVKGFGTTDWKVQHTDLGSVFKIKGKTYAKRWYPAESENISFVAFSKLCRAGNWDAFLKAMRYYSFPPQNFAYADVEGNAGILSAGSMPARPEGYLGGIRKGTTSAPIRYIDFDDLPKALNPKRGYVASANQMPAKTTYYVNYTYADIYRSKRINEVLSSKEKLGSDDMQRLHADVTDVSLQDLKPLLEQYPPSGEEAKAFLPLMKWSGEIRSEESHGVVFAYLNFFLFNGFDSLLMKHYPVELRPRYSSVYRFLKEHPSFRFKNKTYQSADLMKTAYSKALRQLKMDYGQPTNAKAGPMRTFDIKHLLFLPGWGSAVPEVGGTMFTVNVHRGIHGASMRTLIEMRKDGIRSHMVIAGGQSGRVNSPNYRDQLTDWQQVKYHEVQLTNDPKKLRNIRQHIRFNTTSGL